MTEPLPFQKKGVRRIEKFNGRALLADDMGLGKTLQTLWYIRRNRVPLTIVVCPKIVKWHWHNEAREHVNLSSEVLEGRTPNLTSRLLPHARILIINYDILDYWVDVLRNLKPSLIVLDECHYLSGRYTNRTEACRAICRGVKKVIAVSGTAITNRPIDVWPVMSIVRPKLLGSYTAFGVEYCAPKRTFRGIDYRGVNREKMPQLHQLLKKGGMIRRLKSEVAQELPPKQIHVNPLDLSTKGRREYQDAATDLVAWIGKNKGAAAAWRAKKALTMVRIGYLKRIAAKQKLPQAIEWIRYFLESTDRKLAVYGIHIDILKTIHKRFPNSVVVNGQVSPRKRRLAIEQIQHDAETRLFIGNIKAAGTGLDGLQRVISDMAVVEVGWTPGEHWQLIDRLHRIGQENPVTAHFLVAKNTVEEKLCHLLEQKQETLNQVLDGGEGRQDLDIYTQLIKELLNGEAEQVHKTKKTKKKASQATRRQRSLHRTAARRKSTV